jgi:hypothetical protein
MCPCSDNCRCNYYDRAAEGLFFGLGNLAGAGLRGLLKAGTPISQGVQLGIFTSAIDANDIEGCLYSTGAFSQLNVSISGYFDVYVQIDAIPSIDFADPKDLQSIIVSTINGCISREIKSVYQMSIGQPPAEFKDAPGVQQSNYQQLFQLPTTGDQDRSKASGACGAEKGLNYAACALGLKPTQGVWVGVIGTLAGVLILTKVLK